MIRTSGFTPAAPKPEEVRKPVPVPEEQRAELPQPDEQEHARRMVRSLQRSAEQRARRTRLFYWMLFCFLMGMLYGAAFLQQGDSGLWDRLSAVNQSYLYAVQDQADWMVLVQALTSSAVFLALAFLSGFSAIGQPVALFVMFLRGLGLGSYAGYLYLSFGMRGVLFCAVVLLPGALLTVAALALSCREAFRLSNRILLSFLRGQALLKRELLVRYLKKHLLLFLLTVAAAGADCLLRFVFSGIIRLE